MQLYSSISHFTDTNSTIPYPAIRTPLPNSQRFPNMPEYGQDEILDEDSDEAEDSDYGNQPRPNHNLPFFGWSVSGDSVPDSTGESNDDKFPFIDKTDEEEDEITFEDLLDSATIPDADDIGLD